VVTGSHLLARISSVFPEVKARILKKEPKPPEPPSVRENDDGEAE